MDKSAFLDELRLEIGQVREQVRTLSSFYVGITRKFANIMHKHSSVAIYEVSNCNFIMKVCAGPCYLERSLAFGDGVLSKAAIKGDLFFEVDRNMQKLLLPFYKKHHLLGILILHIPLSCYSVTEDDFIFLKEVGRFIEVQHETFSPNPF
ncbi:hypothetical protein JCM9140_4203 [Halalkalibacter wakoensis JCM 9140]|uniref:GAF domain-containing protein n=1 Tax=Halalkalibacter wakoensis JCM 9140 TaxID=1236970 RepID=W4Q7Q4_9BACI|nr:hypothetical protein [Halalkalibacter wakoensis]GAE28017.1 hypothetical protein JCM9140_4203 [Halalkalibacter wakoensis JCM 9140]